MFKHIIPLFAFLLLTACAGTPVPHETMHQCSLHCAKQCSVHHDGECKKCTCPCHKKKTDDTDTKQPCKVCHEKQHLSTEAGK